jgi:hypothetical protein
MTPRQVAVFMEERKWDYRSTFSYLDCSMYQAANIYRSLWFRCRIARRSSHHWVGVYGIQPYWRCHVGSRSDFSLRPVLGVPSLTYNSIFARLISLDLEKRQHFVAAERLRNAPSARSDTHPLPPHSASHTTKSD